MDLDAGHRRNNFDALRIAAALMVLIGHAFVLSGRVGDDPVVRHTAVGGLGEVGVSIFFVISGYLVSGSWDRAANLRSFMAARLLRILPGLAVAVLLTALVLGPLVTRLPAAAYFAEPRTWLYPLRNMLLYPVTYTLPGVFGGAPYPQVVNGSLWTLRLEFTCYLLVPLLWRLTGARRILVAFAALGAALLFVGCVTAGPRLPPIAEIGSRNLFLFVAGAALYAWRDVGWTRGWTTAAVAGAICGLGLGSGAWGAMIATLALPALVTAFALNPLPGVSSVSRRGDYSYGVYIYAFPVQQTLMQVLGPQIGILAFIAMTLMAVAPLAALSWMLVEKPALDLKPRFRARAA